MLREEDLASPECRAGTRVVLVHNLDEFDQGSLRYKQSEEDSSESLKGMKDG